MTGPTRAGGRPSRRWRRAVASALGAIIALTVPAAQADEAAEAPVRLSEQRAREAVRRLQVSSPYRIPAAVRQGRIRYTLGFDDARAWRWPDTGEQAVMPRNGGVTVTVCADCGAESAPSPETIAHYRRANRWVDADDPKIRRFARIHAAGGSVAARMRALVQAVRRHMDGPIDFRAYDSASTALRTRSGDCTEFAVLLAAVARAAGLPARIAYGVAYASRFGGVSHVFSPHAWVQVWDGSRWVSYDAGLGTFDAGHIALWVGDGSPERLQAVSEAIDHLRVIDAVHVQSADLTTAR